MYQDYVANKAKEKTTQLEQYYNQVLSKLQAELNCILFLEFRLFVGRVYNCQVVFLTPFTRAKKSAARHGTFLAPC